MPLVTVLPALRPLLLVFAVALSKPQQRHFDNYIQSLICQDHRRTLAAMSRDVPDGPDASSLERFVTAAPWELPALNRCWRRHLRQELARLKPQGLRLAGRQVDVLIFDDTHHLRTGPMLEGAGYHWVASAHRTRWSHCLVLGAYRTGDYTFAYSCDAYVRRQEVEALNEERAEANLLRAWDAQREPWPFRSKVALVVEQIRNFRPLRRGRPVFVLFDSWYLNRQTVGACQERHLDWCSSLKSNRVVELVDLSLETGEVRKIAQVSVGVLVAALEPTAALRGGEVPFAEAAVAPGWQWFTHGSRKFRAVAYRARVNGLGLVQVVLVQERYEGRGWSPVVALVTNRVDLTAAEVVRVYLERWAIEVLIRDAKQNLGLVDCQMECLEGTARHWMLAFLSQAMLTLLRLRADRGELRTASGQVVGSAGRTLGEVREFVKKCALVELIRWTCQQAAAGQSVEQIAVRLGLPA